MAFSLPLLSLVLKLPNISTYRIEGNKTEIAVLNIEISVCARARAQLSHMHTTKPLNLFFFAYNKSKISVETINAH